VTATRDCQVFPLFQREMVNTVGPGAYDVVSPRDKGAFSNGIVFSSVPRNLDAIPRPLKPLPSDMQYPPASSFGGGASAVAAAAAAPSSTKRHVDARRPEQSLMVQRSLQPSGRAANQTQRSTFGNSKRLLSNGGENPWCSFKAQAPDKIYGGSLSCTARGGLVTPRGTKLGRAARVIRLENADRCAPGPCSYELSHYDFATIIRMK
jgi:hypothetical protein